MFNVNSNVNVNAKVNWWITMRRRWWTMKIANKQSKSDYHFHNLDDIDEDWEDHDDNDKIIVDKRKWTDWKYKIKLYFVLSKGQHQQDDKQTKLNQNTKSD